MKNYMGFKQEKNGITMVTLIITIIVALILISAGIVTVSNSISNAHLASFAEDLSQIEDQVDMYYLQHNSFPTASENEEALSQGDILTLASERYELEKELDLNGELEKNDDMGAFYKIDLSKINVDRTTRGTQADDDEADVYVVSAVTMDVYYVKGYEVNFEVYYSLTSKLVKYQKTTKNTNNVSGISTSVQTVGSLSVKKLNKTWTNKMGINLTAYLNAGESLALSIPGANGQRAFKSDYIKTGNNVFNINSLNDIKDMVTPALTDTEISSFNNIVGEGKSISVIKQKGILAIDTLKIDLSNYDIVPPSQLQDFTFAETEQENIVRFKVTDSESQVKEIRYDFLKKYNENGVLEQYYTGVDSLEEAYIKARGKKASVAQDGTVELKIPKNIEGLDILVLDKADNWTKITKSVATSFYVGASLNAINNTGASFKVAFNNANGIHDYTVQVSTDGTNYTKEIVKTPNTNNKTYSENIDEYKEGLNIQDYLYIKVTARENTDERKSKTSVLKYSKDDATSSFVGESVVDMISGVPIPKGFVASQATGENVKSNGFVIYEGTEPVNDSNVQTARTTRNQFVWVPVDDLTSFQREDGITSNQVQNYVASGKATEIFDYNSNVASQTEINEYNNMLDSVKKYGGFYIARYEASNNNGTAQSVKYMTPWTDIKWADSMTNLSGGAVEKSRGLYNSNNSKYGTVSTLIYGVQWDATLRWLQGNYPNIKFDSTGLGNYKNETVDYTLANGNALTKASGNSAMILTGSSEHCKTNNIYDLCGNVSEWTMEAYEENMRIVRGNSYLNDSGINNTPSIREANSISSTSSRGFRIAMYIK